MNNTNSNADLMRQLIEQQHMQTLVLRVLLSQLAPPQRETFAAQLRAQVNAYLDSPLTGASAQTAALVTALSAMYLEAAGQAPTHGHG